MKIRDNSAVGHMTVAVAFIVFHRSVTVRTGTVNNGSARADGEAVILEYVMLKGVEKLAAQMYESAAFYTLQVEML